MLDPNLTTGTSNVLTQQTADSRYIVNGGAGTTAITGGLAVSGTITAGVGTSNSPSYSFSGNLNTGIYSPGTNTLSIATNGSERMRIYDNGNMAFDDFTNLPGAASNSTYKVFHFASPTIAGSTMVSMASRGRHTSFFGDSGFNFIIGTEGANPIIFRNNLSYGDSDTLNSGVEKMRIDGNGNVGIGTSSPVEILEVNGRTKIDNILYSGGYINDTNLPIQIVGSLAQFGVSRTSGTYGLLFGSYNSNTYAMRTVQSTDNLSFVVNNNIKALNIAPSGNVGIGTTTPLVSLDVNGQAAFRSTSALIVGNGQTGIINIGDSSFSKTFGSSFRESLI